MLIDEIEQVQNPGLGATLIWRFACGYESGGNQDGIPLPYAFLLVPLLFNKAVLSAVASTQKGLRKVEEKLNGAKAPLAAMQEHALAMRGLSQQSLALALRAGLITLDVGNALMRPRSVTAPSVPDEEAAKLLKAADKLGLWASQVSLREFCFVFHLEL